MRNDLKLAARAGRFPNYRMPSYEKLAKTKTDAEIIESASRTNPGANGAGVAGAAGAVSNAIVTAAQGRGVGGCQ